MIAVLNNQIAKGKAATIVIIRTRQDLKARLYQLIQNSKRSRRRKINNYRHHHQQKSIKTTLMIAENFKENDTVNIFQPIHFCILSHTKHKYLCA